MSGILLTPGPAATRKAVKSLSQVFNLSVTKAKFEAAANKLHAANLGMFMTNVGNNRVNLFLKKSPEEARDILLMAENSDLCTPEEYEQRFRLKTRSYSLTSSTVTYLVKSGFVSADHFK